MDELIEALKKAQADTFAFYLKAHNYHWNVESHAFSLYHAFFGTLYEDAFDAVDTIAEHTRTLDAYVPGSFTRFKELATIEDEVNVPSAKTMIEKLESVIKEIGKITINSATELEEYRIKYLSRKGMLNDLFEEFKQIRP